MVVIGSGYRYGFNGKENDNEVKGNGNSQDYGMRIYDPRVGRFLSVDPITKQYPELTPYQFASNRPIDGIDMDGLEFLDIKKYNKGAVWGILKFKVGTLYTVDDLQKKNLAVHSVVVNHPDYKKPYGQERLDDPAEANSMVVKKRASSGRSQAFSNMEAKTARAEGAADIVGGIIDATKWGIKTVYNFRNKEELEYASASIMALNKADNLVKAAINNPTFPSKLKDPTVLTDLVNYMVDYNRPDGGLYYSNVITTWGQLIYNNRDAISQGSFNFSPMQTTSKLISIPSLSDMKINFGFRTEIKGNTNPEVNNANKLIENHTPQRPAAVKEKN